MLRSALPLALIAGVCASLLVLTQTFTGPRIERNTREHQLRMIAQLAGAIPTVSTSWSDDVWDLCNETLLVRAEVSGYGGPISLLIAAGVEGPERLLRGVRITSHQETPGLADFLARPDQGWLGAFKGQRATDLGTIDAVAGATITSKAVLSGLLRALSTAQHHEPAPGACAT